MTEHQDGSFDVRKPAGQPVNQNGFELDQQARRESTRTVMVSEINSMERRIEELHLSPPWNDTLLGAAFGVLTSAGFGLIGLYQTGNAPGWTLIVMWGFLFAGVTAVLLCFAFKHEFKDVEKSQKQQLINDMEHWKGADV